MLRIARTLARIMTTISGVGILVLLLLTVLHVSGRELLGTGVPGAIEYSQIVLVAVVFAGMGGAEVRKAHVRTPLLTSRLPPRTADVARLLGIALVLCSLAWLIWLTLRAGLESAREGEYGVGTHRVPVWPARLVIPLGLTGLALEYVVNAMTVGRRIWAADHISPPTQMSAGDIQL
jgi:TRAP-type C4-dicarboxylate transport system permease small subunit